MPTDLFVRRPLLWLQLASKKRVTLTCSPNFGYRHFLKVLGGRRLENVDLSCIRAHLQRRRADLGAALQRVHAGARLHRAQSIRAMYPVYGLAEACLAVTFPEAGSRLPLDPRQPAQARPGFADIEVNPADARDVIELMCVGRVAAEHGAAHRRRRARGRCRTEHVGHILIRGPNVTRGYFGDPEATATALDARGLARHGRSRRVSTRASCTSPDAARKSSSSTARITTPTIWRTSRSAPRARSQQGRDRRRRQARRPGRGARGVRAAPRRPRGVPADGGRGQPPDQRAHRNRGGRSDPGEADPEDHERQGAAASVGAGATSTANSTRTSPSSRHCARRTRGPHVTGSDLEGAAAGDLRGGVAGQAHRGDDNLFEIGASSLKLIEIHENIDRDYPGLIDLTELFDHPTIAELAKHLQGKLRTRRRLRPSASARRRTAASQSVP